MRNQEQVLKISDIREVPAAYERRNCTDVLCIIVGGVFFFVMIILGISLFNFNNYYRTNFPSDSEGRLCGVDEKAKHYPYLYFTRPPNITMRVCVAECPRLEDSKLKCLPTEQSGCFFTTSQGYEVVNYENQKSETRSGYFCYPTDPTLKQQLLVSSKLKVKSQFYNSIDTIVLCFYISVGLCIFYLGCAQFLHKNMGYVVLVLGCLMMLACCVCIGVYDSNQLGAKGLEIAVLLLFLLIIVISVFRYHSSWRVHTILMHYSKQLVRDRYSVLLYIPIFFAFLIFFVLIIIFEFTAFWSAGILTFDSQKQVFYQLQGGGPITLTIILAIQAIWGFSFIKAAFNFCVSCFAVQWYYDIQSTLIYPFKLLLFKHLGSVIGGSFISGFFAPLDFILDALKPHRYGQGCYASCCSLFSCCTDLLDLVREDSISYLVLTGNPYCNSSRYCEYLCEQSVIMDYSQSTSRSYRLSAHFLITGVMVMVALYIKGEISINAIFAIILLSLSTSTLFISLHCDIAEAMQIILITDEQLARRAHNTHYQVVDEVSIRQQLQRLKLYGELVRQIMEERIGQKKREDHDKSKPKQKTKSNQNR